MRHEIATCLYVFTHKYAHKLMPLFSKLFLFIVVTLPAFAADLRDLCVLCFELVLALFGQCASEVDTWQTTTTVFFSLFVMRYYYLKFCFYLFFYRFFSLFFNYFLFFLNRCSCATFCTKIANNSYYYYLAIVFVVFAIIVVLFIAFKILLSQSGKQRWAQCQV